jgi:hypothetical protein
MIRVQAITLNPFFLNGISLLMDDMVDMGGTWESKRKSWDCKTAEDGADETEPHGFRLTRQLLLHRQRTL